jgi:catechol 2,3-dioxygenase-like lactoylglutathione lyase family enzyme
LAVPNLEFQVEVFPSDVDRSVDFYTRVLGFEVVRDRRASGSAYVAVSRGAARIGISAAWEPTDASVRRVPHGVELVLEVDDLSAERARIVAEAWPLAEDVQMRSWGREDFRLFDPDGYYIRITTREPRAR